MSLPKILFSVFMFAFIFSLPLIFTLLAVPCWPLAFLIFSLPLWNLHVLFWITCSSSFSVIHVRVNTKNNVEKDTTSLLFFFLSKSPGVHAISFQIKPWVAFGLPYPLIELFYIGVPVVRTDGWSGGRTVTWLPKFLGCIGYQIFLPMVLRFPRARESSAINIGCYMATIVHALWLTAKQVRFAMPGHY